MSHIIDTQHKVIEYQKKMKMTKLFTCVLIIDDFSEDKTFIYEIFGLSVITNALDALAPIVRMVIIILQMVSRFNGSISASGPHAAQVKQDDIARRAKRFQLAWP